MSDSQRPHGLQPTRLLCPWDFPGKNTGVGCHCLLQIYYRVLHKIQTYLNCNPPVSSIHGIFQARILEWVAIPFSRRSSPPRDQTWEFLHCRRILYHLSHQRNSKIKYRITIKSFPSRRGEIKSSLLRASHK